MPNRGDFDKKTSGKTGKFYKKCYKKISPLPNWKTQDCRLKIFMKCSTHSGLSLRYSRWQGKQRFPPAQRVGSKVTKEVSGLRKALAFSTATQKPKKMEKRPWKSGRKYFWLGSYPPKPSIRYLLKSASQWGLSWPPSLLLQHPLSRIFHTPTLALFSFLNSFHYTVEAWTAQGLGVDPCTAENPSITFDSLKV